MKTKPKAVQPTENAAQAAAQKASVVPTVKPLGKRVPVLPDEPEKVSAGGIVLPDAAQERPTRGTVIVAGLESEMQAGAVVLYPKYAGSPVEIEKVSYIILNDSDLFLELLRD